MPSVNFKTVDRLAVFMGRQRVELALRTIRAVATGEFPPDDGPFHHHHFPSRSECRNPPDAPCADLFLVRVDGLVNPDYSRLLPFAPNRAWGCCARGSPTPP